MQKLKLEIYKINKSCFSNLAKTAIVQRLKIRYYIKYLINCGLSMLIKLINL